MKLIINFVVDGKPMGKQRPRFRRTKKYVSTYTPQKTVDYEELVRKSCHEKMQEMEFEGWQDSSPLYVKIHAYFEIPKSYSLLQRTKIKSGELTATKKPDFDNIAKIVCDSLNGLLYKDDSQIVKGIVCKHYSDKPRVEVEIGDMLER